MGMNVTWAEELLSFIGIRPDLATYPMEYYTPEGATLTDANFVETFESAVAAAQAADGGIVQVPAGVWSLDETLEVVSAGRNKPIYVDGAGINCTVFRVPTGFTGTLFHLTGLAGDGAADWYYDGGLANFSVDCLEEDVSTTGTAIHIEACIGTQFLNIVIRNLSGGTGFKSTFTAPDNTNQYVQLWNITVGSCGTSYDLTSFVNCQGYGVYSGSAQDRDFLCDDVKASFYGGYIQSSPDICIELAGNGGCQLVFHDFYYEGFADTIFKFNSPAVTSNQVAVYNMHMGGTPDVFVDTDAFNDVSLNYINRAADATVILKARNGANTMLFGVGDPLSLPAKFDLDAASAAQTFCAGNGATWCGQNKFSPRAEPADGPTLYVDIADGDLKFKNAGGVVTVLT